MTDRRYESMLQKLEDASHDVEVNMKMLRKEIEQGLYTTDGCKLLLDTQKKLQKIGIYLLKLPAEKLCSPRSKK